MMFDRLLSAALIATVITGLSVVCIAAAQTQSRARGPSPQRGAVIAAQGTLNGAPAWAQCHAFNGVSDGSGAFPRIAGQSAYYLAKQLRDFTSGIRVNAISPGPFNSTMMQLTLQRSMRPSCRCRDPTRRSSRGARSLRKWAAPQTKFRHAIIAMELTAQASHRQFLILPVNMRPTSPSNGECGGVASERAALVRWPAWQRISPTRRSRQQLPITSRSEDLPRPLHRSRRFHVD